MPKSLNCIYYFNGGKARLNVLTDGFYSFVSIMPQTRIDISKAKLLFTCKLESDLRGD